MANVVIKEQLDLTVTEVLKELTEKTVNLELTVLMV